MGGRRGIGITVLAGSLLSVSYGLIRQSPFTPHLWSADGMQAQASFALFLAGIFLCARWFSRKYRVSLPALLALPLGIESLVFYGILPVMSVAIFLASGFALGHLLFTRTGRGREGDPLLRLLAGLATLAIFFCWISPISVNGIAFHYGLLGALLLGMTIWNGRKAYSWATRLEFMRSPGHRPRREELLICGLFLMAAFILLVGAAPDTGYDGLAMHLYIPSYMRGHARWSYDPLRYAFSFMPAAADFLFAHVYLCGGERSVLLFQVTTILISALTAYRIARGGSAKIYALTATLLILAPPFTLLTASNLMVEPVLAMWVCGAAYILCAAERSGPSRWPALGACLGAACATKLHGVVAAPLLFLGAIYCFRPLTRKDTKSILCAVAFVVLGCFPYGYAWLKVGNPVYPFYNDLFGAPLFPPVRLVDIRWTGHLHWSLLYDMAFNSSAFMECINGVLGFTWLALLPLGITSAITQKNRTALLVSAVAVTAILISSQTVQYIRYLYPFSFLLCAALACAMEEIGKIGLRTAYLPLTLFLIGTDVWLWPTGFPVSDSVPTNIVSGAKREKFERRTAPARLANKMINATGIPDAHVLYPEAPAGGLLEGTAIYVNWYSHYFNWYARRVADDETLAKFLSVAEIDFVIQPKAPEGRFSVLLGSYLGKTRRPVAEFGDVLVYRTDRPHAAVR